MQAKCAVADFEELFSSGAVAVVVTGKVVVVTGKVVVVTGKVVVVTCTGFLASTGFGGNILLPSGFLSTT